MNHDMKAKDRGAVVNHIDRKGTLWLSCRDMNAPSLLSLGGLALALVSCGSFKSMNQPLSGTSGFDPLGAPGSGGNSPVIVAPTSPSYTPGQWVETSMDNATFFLAVPQGNARANKVLPSGTPMKVVSNSGTYVRVELDSGQVGYVPEIMIAERRSPNEVPLNVSGVPLPGTVPPPVDPGVTTDEGLAPPPEIPGTPPPIPSVVPPVPTVPDVAPPPEIPGITDPEVID